MIVVLCMPSYTHFYVCGMNSTITFCSQQLNDWQNKRGRDEEGAIAEKRGAPVIIVWIQGKDSESKGVMRKDW